MNLSKPLELEERVETIIELSQHDSLVSHVQEAPDHNVSLDDNQTLPEFPPTINPTTMVIPKHEILANPQSFYDVLKGMTGHEYTRQDCNDLEQLRRLWLASHSATNATTEVLMEEEDLNHQSNQTNPYIERTG